MSNVRWEFFKTLEFKESRQRSLWMSLAVHGALLFVLLVAPLILTDRIEVARFNSVPLVPPPERREIIPQVTPYRQWKQPRAEPVLAGPPQPKLPDPPKVAKIIPPVLVESPETPAVIRSIHTLDAAAATPAVPAALPRMDVRTGIFPSESPAKPPANLSAAQVQTGGFGDPNGMQGTGKPDKVPNAVSLGSFGLPAGPGAGNGSGGSHGANGLKATVATTEFGNGVAPVGSRGAGSGSQGAPRSVHRAGFEDVDAAKAEAPKVRSDIGPPQTPAEILSKPRPDYTDEARKLRVEGEVLVRVLFTANGGVRVIDVVRGLGHGLDESALRAVEHIKFKPAQRDGQPVDSTATVHIVFQLAY